MVGFLLPSAISLSVYTDIWSYVRFAYGNNQLAATIKLQEVWKAVNVEGCPITLDPYNKTYENQELRTKYNRIFNDSARLKISQSSFYIDAARLWNGAPLEIRVAKSQTEAKRLIKIYASSLPI